MRHFEDRRYLRVDGKPVFYVFRPEGLPDPARFVDRLRRLADRAGLPGLFLIAELNDPLGRKTFGDPWAVGFDAGVDLTLPADRRVAPRIAMRVLRRLGLPEIYPYAGRAVERAASDPQCPMIPSVVPGWDNTPRAGRQGLVLHGATPAKFATHVEAALRYLASSGSERRILLIKSWNEWAEGNHLEPDLRFGRAFLEALRDSVDEAAASGAAPADLRPAH